MIIAIDGPAGSGKSTVARQVAAKLNFQYIETGSMYRAVAWKARQRGIDLGDQERVAEVARRLDLEFVPRPEGQVLLVDGENASPVLKDEDVGRGAAVVAAYKEVRDIMTAKQREIGRSGNVVMDGRDIGTIVFPEADRKFFLDADPAERGRRRYLELKGKNQEVDLDVVVEQVKQRDHEDRNRPIAPLKPAPDAILVDTTHLRIEEVVDEVARRIQAAPAS
ncbi:MAG: (d)CMP kinase [Nitrospinae bacterium]|nr:(d)CMP kinase [Nitrospinota bacterium]